MLSKWRIRNKLLLCGVLLLVLVGSLSAASFFGLYAYRGLVKGLSSRSTELPLAAELSQQVSDLRVTLSGVRSRQEYELVGHAPLDNQFLREQFRMNLKAIEATIERYRGQLELNEQRDSSPIQDNRQERESLARIDEALALIHRLDDDSDWLFDEVKTVKLAAEVEKLHQLAARLPGFLRERLQELALDVRIQYRMALFVSWTSSIAAVLTFVTLSYWMYSWIFRPLGVLVQGSRDVAQGNFGRRIELATHDEMSELGDAMNDMTARFQEIRDDLDHKVRERTKQVVRSEQLASVGFLAAGVAHEINNPLASIAFCSESLEQRMREVLQPSDTQYEVIQHYLRMIQDEAFRCKEITAKLLDFSRMGDVQHHRVELRELVGGVIEMVGHLGRYRDKSIELLPGETIYAEVSPQEMKQVVLNLITNGLDSLDPGGKVSVELRRRGNQAELTFRDNGCGMTPEVLTHLYEPFFTRKRGGQGTGLGLSISYRIIADHDGQIEAHSDGPGLGSRFVVSLPLAGIKEKEKDHQYQAA